MLAFQLLGYFCSLSKENRYEEKIFSLLDFWQNLERSRCLGRTCSQKRKMQRISEEMGYWTNQEHYSPSSFYLNILVPENNWVFVYLFINREIQPCMYPKLFGLQEHYTSYSMYVSNSIMPDSLWPHWLQPTSLLWPWDFPDKDTGMGCHFLLQRIFLTQESNSGLLPSRHILYRLSYTLYNHAQFSIT